VDITLIAGSIVENKRLSSTLAFIQTLQAKRDEERLASPKVRVAEKERLRAKREALFGEPLPSMPKRPRGRPPKTLRPDRITLAGVDPNGPVQAFFDRALAEQTERRRSSNQRSNDRKRAREFMEAQRRPRTQP
jgi:hypothetical protein